MLEEINPKYSLEGLMLKLKFQYFDQLMKRADSLEKTPSWERLRQKEKATGWDGWMASPTQWTWIWANSGRRWRAGKPGVLQSVGSQGSDMAQWLDSNTATMLLSRAVGGRKLTLLLPRASLTLRPSFLGPLTSLCLRGAWLPTCKLTALTGSWNWSQDGCWGLCTAEGTRSDHLCEPFHLPFQGCGR